MFLIVRFIQLTSLLMLVGTGDGKEGYYIGVHKPPSDPLSKKPLHGPNLYPSEGTSLSLGLPQDVSSGLMICNSQRVQSVGTNCVHIRQCIHFQMSMFLETIRSIFSKAWVTIQTS